MRNGYLNINVENLDKGVNGVHLSRWIDLPQNQDSLIQILKSIEITEPNNNEDYLINGYETSINHITDHLGRHEKIGALNDLAAAIDTLTEKDLKVFESALSLSNGTLEVNELIQLTKNLDEYTLSEDLKDAHALGVFCCSKEMGIDLLSEELMNHIDYEGFGKEIAEKQGGAFTANGYIQKNKNMEMQYTGGEINMQFTTEPEPFKIFNTLIKNQITDNETWAKFPMPDHIIDDHLRSIKVSPTDQPNGFYIKTSESDIKGLRKYIARNEPSLTQINHLCEGLKSLDNIEIEKFESLLEVYPKNNISWFIDATSNMNCFELYPADSQSELGNWIVFEIRTHSLPENDDDNFQGIDYELECTAEDFIAETKGKFTSNGYFFRTKEPFIPVYQATQKAPEEQQPNTHGKTTLRPEQEPPYIFRLQIAGTSIQQYGIPTTDNKHAFIEMPMAPEELEQAFYNIDANVYDYSSYMYNCYSTTVKALDPHFDNFFCNMREANYLAGCISSLNEGDRQKFDAIIGAQSELTVAKAINFALEMDCYAPFTDIKNLEDLGERLVNDGVREAPTENINAQDYKEIGAEFQAQKGGYFTSMGFVKQTDYPTEQSYSGPEDIPKQGGKGPSMKM